MTGLQSLTITKDGFAFDASTGENFTLNGCGSLILSRLKNGESRQEIASFLADQFGIGCNTAERDIADFFQQLHTLGLVDNN